MGLGGGARRGMWMQIGAANGGSGEAEALRREADDGSQVVATVMAMARGRVGESLCGAPVPGGRRSGRTELDGTGIGLSRWRMELGCQRAELERAWFELRARL